MSLYNSMFYCYIDSLVKWDTVVSVTQHGSIHDSDTILAFTVV